MRWPFLCILFDILYWGIIRKEKRGNSPTLSTGSINLLEAFFTTVGYIYEHKDDYRYIHVCTLYILVVACSACTNHVYPLELHSRSQ